MSEFAVITICIGKEYEEMSKISHPTIKNYADKIGADFIVIDTETQTPHWEKFSLYKYLKKYKRIIFLDTDIIVRPDTPNLFDIVPYNKIGMFNEGKYAYRRDALEQVFEAYEKKNLFPKNWDSSYYNTGVMVFSRFHMDLFKSPEIKHGLKYFEQSYINLRLILDKYEIFSLSYKFNRMCVMDELTGDPRENSYINHYAGEIYFRGFSYILNNMTYIVNKWNEHYPDYHYKKNIIIRISGGLGDQVCGEPATRYFIDKLYPNENITVVTDYPEIFQHLNAAVVDEETIQNNKVAFETYFSYTHPPINHHPIWNIVPNTQACAVDFCSICLCAQMLPFEDRTIKLSYSQDSLKTVLDICNAHDIFVEQLILIHPGYGWINRTFPKEWWQEIIDSLCEKGHKVGVIGKFIKDDPNDRLNSHGYVDVECNHKNCIDFRDILTVEELTALISKSKMVISNDSSPIHIAGAFDTYIVLIPTCRHPDLVLPYRNNKGEKYKKVSVLYKKLTMEPLRSSPIEIKTNGQELDYINGNILDFIPDPIDIINEVNFVYGEII